MQLGNGIWNNQCSGKTVLRPEKSVLQLSNCFPIPTMPLKHGILNALKITLVLQYHLLSSARYPCIKERNGTTRARCTLQSVLKGVPFKGRGLSGASFVNPILPTAKAIWYFLQDQLVQSSDRLAVLLTHVKGSTLYCYTRRQTNTIQPFFYLDRSSSLQLSVNSPTSFY